MKATLKVICALSACLCLASCGQKPTEASAGYAVAGNDYVDYTFEYPEDWNLTDDTGMIAVKAPKDNVSLSVTTFELEDPSLAVNAYWYGIDKDGNVLEAESDVEKEMQGYFEYLKSTLGGTVEVISDVETTLSPEKIPARQITYKAEVAGAVYQFTQVVAIKSGEVYTITYTAKPETHDTYKGALTHTLLSFVFKA